MTPSLEVAVETAARHLPFHFLLGFIEPHCSTLISEGSTCLHTYLSPPGLICRYLEHRIFTAPVFSLSYPFYPPTLLTLTRLSSTVRNSCFPHALLLLITVHAEHAEDLTDWHTLGKAEVKVVQMTELKWILPVCVEGPLRLIANYTLKSSQTCCTEV